MLMGNKFSKLNIICLSVAVTIIMNLIGIITAFGAANADINRIFSKINTNAENGINFMEKLYKAGESYKEQGIDDTYIDRNVKAFIGNILDDVAASYNSGKLNDDNFQTELKKIVISRAGSLDIFILSIISDAFPDDIVYVLKGQIPPSFNTLFEALVYETKIIIGLTKQSEEIMFSDMGEYLWANEAVLSLAKMGIINGISKTEFAPSQNVTREQFAKMLALAIKVDITNPKSSFSDVPSDSWFYPYVSALADSELLNGIDKALFGTGYDITRQDMAVLMFRAGHKMGKFTEFGSEQFFADEDDISDYAKSAVNTLRALGIVNGTPENYFNPTKSASRAEAAQMLYNFYQYITTTE